MQTGAEAENSVQVTINTTEVGPSFAHVDGGVHVGEDNKARGEVQDVDVGGWHQRVMQQLHHNIDNTDKREEDIFINDDNNESCELDDFDPDRENSAGIRTGMATKATDIDHHDHDRENSAGIRTGRATKATDIDHHDHDRENSLLLTSKEIWNEKKKNNNNNNNNAWKATVAAVLDTVLDDHAHWHVHSHGPIATGELTLSPGLFFFSL
jgi:hypothetical protein